MNAHAFSTADLCDAHGSDCQICITPLRQYGGRRIFCGQVRTIMCRNDNVLLRRALEQQSPGEVLVVDGGGSLEAALIGDIVAGLGLKNGWSGVIIFGAVRDAVALGGLAFGVKALGTNPRKSGKAGAGAVDVVVQQGGAVFSPGSWVYSDDDGVVVSPRKLG